MANKPGLTWLASYPKSGSTWTRAFLSAHHHDIRGPLPLKLIPRSSMSDSRWSDFEKLLARKRADLSEQDVVAARSRQQRQLVDRIEAHQVVKTHNAQVQVFGTPLIDPEFTQRAVYVVRNPFDIVDSWADHAGINHQQAIHVMNDPQHRLGGVDSEQVLQYVCTWSTHVESWLSNPCWPTFVVRYEDLVRAPHDSFSKLIEFLGWEPDTARLDRAIQSTAIKALQEREAEHGFVESSRNAATGAFFRRGEIGSWSKILTKEQAEQIIANHSHVMRVLGYATPDLESIYDKP